MKTSIFEQTSAVALLMGFICFKFFCAWKNSYRRLSGKYRRKGSRFSSATFRPGRHSGDSVEVPLIEGISRYTLSNGYVLRIERIYEHRAVAKKILGRDLASHECVHHIFGRATQDNRPENLCVLDRTNHDLFHSYLQRERKIKGRYPSLDFQKSLLKVSFNGLLLEEVSALKGAYFPPVKKFMN